MKGLIDLFKVMLQGGLMVVLPALLLVMLIDQVVGLLVVIVKPIADLFPPDTFAQAKFPLILALILLLGASLLVGLAMRSAMARRIGSWIERQTIGRLPMYGFVKTLTTGLLGGDQATAFKPALLVSEGNQREFIYVIEDHGSDLTILQPWAPTAFSGSIKIIPRESVQPIDAPLVKVTEVLNHLGLGAHALLDTPDKNRE